MNEAHWKLVFRSAALFNLLVAAPFALAPAVVLPALGFDAGAILDNPLWYGLFWWLVAVFGVAYWIIGSDPVQHRAIVLLGLLGKSGVWAIVLALWLQGTAPGLFALIVAGDLVYALLFLGYLMRRPRFAMV